MFKSLPKILLVIGFLMGGSANAYDIQAVATQVQKVYGQTQDLSMTFVQDTYVQLLEQNVKKKGAAKFKKPGKFSIRYEGKRGKYYLSDGKKLTMGRKGDSKVQTQAVQSEEIPAEALSFLGGLGNLKNDFEIESVDSKKWEAFKRDPGKLLWLELTPQKKRSSIEWLVVGFDPESYLTTELYIYTDSGNLSHYTFKELKPNQGLSDQEFQIK